MSESKLQSRVLAKIKKQYPLAVVFKLSDRWLSGLPDLLIIINGQVLFVELKTDTGVLSKIQLYTINRINNAGGRALVCRSVDEVIDAIKKQ